MGQKVGVGDGGPAETPLYASLVFMSAILRVVPLPQGPQLATAT